MPIEIQTNEERDFTELVASGFVTDEEMIEAQSKLYANKPTLLHLWNMAEADVSQTTTGALRTFIDREYQDGKTRQNGKSAVVIRGTLQFGIARMAETIRSFKEQPFDMKIFKEKSQALRWLES